LLASHDELRTALIVAGKRIRQLNFGRRNDSVLPLLRQALKDGRIERAKFTRRRASSDLKSS
jgi:hypothetical protein